MEKLLFITNRLRPCNNAEAFQSTMIAKYLSENFQTYVMSTTRNPSDIGRATPIHVPSKPDSSAGSRIEHMYSRLGRDVKVKFPDTHAGWTADAVRAASELIVKERIGTLITRSMPVSTHLIGLKTKELHPGIKWVASMSDPLSINPYLRYSSKSLRARIAAYENDIFSKADIITHSNSYVIEAYRKTYGSLPGEHIVLSNMFDRLQVEKKRHILSEDGILILTYAGRFYGRRTPEPLFKAVRMFLDGGGRLKLNLVGSGKSRRLAGLVKKYRLTNTVEIMPFLEPDGLAALLTESHLLVTIDGDFPGVNIFLPSKNIDYLSMTVPILGITRKGPTSDVIEETRSGFWTEPQETDRMLTILSSHSEHVRNGYDFTPNHEKVLAYRASNVIGQFLKEVGSHGSQ